MQTALKLPITALPLAALFIAPVTPINIAALMLVSAAFYYLSSKPRPSLVAYLPVMALTCSLVFFNAALALAFLTPFGIYAAPTACVIVGLALVTTFGQFCTLSSNKQANALGETDPELQLTVSKLHSAESRLSEAVHRGKKQKTPHVSSRVRGLKLRQKQIRHSAQHLLAF